MSLNQRGSAAVILYLLLGVFATGTFALSYVIVRLLAAPLLALGVPPIAAAASIGFGLLAAMAGLAFLAVRSGRG